MIPSSPIPQHVAIIMDGNGRWAKKRFLPRAQGHRRGLTTLHEVVEASVKAGIRTLTVFAFSSENWHRPESEVRLLMELFASGLKKWTPQLKAAGVRIRIIGDMSAFSAELLEVINESESATRDGTNMLLNIAANYGGRWDITQAAQKVMDAGLPFTEANLSRFMAVCDVDLLIRTGGENRLSNFLLWESSYAELFFSEKLWPDFDEHALLAALAWYEKRERRFGRTSEQIQGTKGCELTEPLKP